MQDDSLQLTLFLTNTCNLNCVYCYEQHKDKRFMTGQPHQNFVNSLRMAQIRGML